MKNFYNNKKIFITGHTGFQGSWLCKILKIMGSEITGYALAPDKEPNLFTLAGINNDVKTIYADIRDISSLKQALNTSKPDIVIHMAAQALVIDSYKNPSYTYETNIMGTVNIFEAIREYEKPISFLNITTDKVYKDLEYKCGYKETDELKGRDPYSNSKSCSELITYSYKKSFFENSRTSISTARLGNVIGGGDFANDRIIPDALKALLNQEKLILRNPESIRPYQHIIEALFAYLLIIKKQFENKDLAGNYNIGPEPEDYITTAELVNLFYSYFDNAKWTTEKNKGPYEACFLMLDTTKIKEVLGWKPLISINKAVEMTAEWTKAYINKENYNEVMDKQIKEYIKLLQCN